MASTASFSLRSALCRELRSDSFTSCWVMVDPPSCTAPDSRLTTMARVSARTSMAPCSKNRSSSASRTARMTCWGTRSRLTGTRSSSAWNVARTLPSRAYTTDRAGRGWRLSSSPWVPAVAPAMTPTCFNNRASPAAKPMPARTTTTKIRLTRRIRRENTARVGAQSPGRVSPTPRRAWPPAAPCDVAARSWASAWPGTGRRGRGATTLSWCRLQAGRPPGCSTQGSGSWFSASSSQASCGILSRPLWTRIPRWAPLTVASHPPEDAGEQGLLEVDGEGVGPVGERRPDLHVALGDEHDVDKAVGRVLGRLFRDGGPEGGGLASPARSWTPRHADGEHLVGAGGVALEIGAQSLTETPHRPVASEHGDVSRRRLGAVHDLGRRVDLGAILEDEVGRGGRRRTHLPGVGTAQALGEAAGISLVADGVGAGRRRPPGREVGGPDVGGPGLRPGGSRPSAATCGDHEHHHGGHRRSPPPHSAWRRHRSDRRGRTRPLRRAAVLVCLALIAGVLGM